MIGKQERTSSSGNRLAFVQLSDAGGMFEVTVFSEVLGQARDLLASGKPLLVTVDARLEEEVAAPGADASRRSTTSSPAPPRACASSSATPAASPSSRSIIAAERRGRGRVSILVDLAEDREVEVALKESYAVSALARSKLQTVPGIVAVEEV